MYKQMYKQTYEQNLNNEEFLIVTFNLMLKKVKRLQEINSKSKKGKLPLPLLKEKFESTSKILQALREMINMLDYKKTESSDIAEMYNIIGQRISLANMDMDDKIYQNVIDIIESFLDV